MKTPEQWAEEFIDANRRETNRLVPTTVEDIRRVQEDVLREPPCEEVNGLLPVVLYFKSEAERRDFIRMAREVNPGMEAKAL